MHKKRDYEIFIIKSLIKIYISVLYCSPNILAKLRPQSGAQIVDSVSSPLMAETLALRHGMEVMLQSGIHTATIFSDCLTLIRVINSNSQIKEIYGVLQDIDRLSSKFASILFRFIPRSQNREADVLAKQALKALYPSVVPF